MKKTLQISIMTWAAAMLTTAAGAQTTGSTVEIIRRANDYWQKTNPNYGRAVWNIAAYHTGNMAAYAVTQDPRYLAYSEGWAAQNQWKGAPSDDKSRWKARGSYKEYDEWVLFGDWQTCFQTYIDLNNIAPAPYKIARAVDVMEFQMATATNEYWWWADGLYMAMPVMTKLFLLTKNEQYLQKLHDYFSYTKQLLFDADAGLFYRDKNYVFPTHTTNSGGKDFWSRGNGWVFAGLAKVLTDLPKDHVYRDEYISVFRSMARALRAAQQSGGYWTRSILDTAQAPGYETSGTAFFTFGMLWGINNGILGEEYKSTALAGWKYLTEVALQPDGLVGYVQPIGEKAADNQAVNIRTTADFGVGAFLLAAAEMTRYKSTK